MDLAGASKYQLKLVYRVVKQLIPDQIVGSQSKCFPPIHTNTNGKDLASLLSLIIYLLYKLSIPLCCKYILGDSGVS